ncbi:M66 family metalloprotease [Photobacterium sp. Alg240-V54]|uniref:M66 family metalloprotease n=1 Tax=Photobacterium sp. Alg240-V54 TaxID=2305995 RepID=UPI0013D14858|nr:M66 family metalloprotease [Photobacterium sp. Alg240-V54]
MNIKPISLAVSALLCSYSGASFATSSTPTEAVQQLEQIKAKVLQRVVETQTLIADPTNIEIRNGQRFLKYNGYLYSITSNNLPSFMPFVDGFDYADRSAEAMFDFIQAPWKLVNQMDGVYIYNDQFGYNYMEHMDQDKQCNVQYLVGDKDLVSTATKDCLPYNAALIDAHGFIDDQPIVNHLNGDLAAQIRFIQNQTAEPSGNDEKDQQRIVSQREALLVLTPMVNHEPKSIELKIYKDGVLLESRQMTNPLQILESDRAKQDDRKDVIYSKRSFTTVLPWNWVEQGLSLQFETYTGLSGELAADDIDFAAPAHLDLPMIRIGMLTEPPAAKPLELKPAHYGSELFQRFPLASMTISHYLPIKLDKVVMSNGDIKTEYSDYASPGIHSGDMREDITKSLIQLGIANANYGVASSGANQWQADNYPAIVIGHSIGRYKNDKGEVGNYTHGLSGGNGMVLLADTTGNEVTHEIGHALSMGHYPGGYANATHGATTGWGYDAYRGYMADNLNWWSNVDGEYGYGDIMVTPYKTHYGYGTDPMGGGGFDSSTSSYPLFTGYSSKRIQHYLESKDYLDATSASGYSHWNAVTQQFEAVATTTKLKPVQQGVDVMTVVGFYDPQLTNTSYIYPALYGSSGNVYDLPQPVAGQCWATVTYGDNTQQIIGLEGARKNGGLSNKLHFNLARDRNPQTVTVECPQISLETIVRDELLTHYDQERFYAWGENNRWGEIGDVFEYHRNGRVELFALKTQSYWYFPESGDSNHQWEFIGYLDQIIADKQPTVDFDALGRVTVDSRTFVANTEYPAKAITIGKGLGYDLAIESQPLFTEQSDLENLDFETMNQFDLWVADRYGKGELNNGVTHKRKRAGAVYVHINTELNTRDYFLMKTITAGEFPTDHHSNNDWKYLGSAESYVNFDFNPLKLNRQNLSNIERVKNYFEQSALFTWDQRTTTTWDSSNSAVFINPTAEGVNEYFIQRTPAQGGEFPTNKASNRDWIYLADDNSLNQLILEMSTNQAVFEQLVLDWYKQDSFGNWGDNGQTGNVGDIFTYHFHDGKTHYYRLKTTSYGYFPWPSESPDPSNGHWQYISHY